MARYMFLRIYPILLILVLTLGLLPLAHAQTPSGLLVSTKSDRSNPIELDGAVLGGNVWVYTANATSIRRVLFYIDDPARMKAPVQSEGIAPYELAGGAPSDMSLLDAGQHTVTAAVTTTSGTVSVLNASFSISDAIPTPAPTHAPVDELLVSKLATRSDPLVLHGATVSGTIWVFTRQTSGIAQVLFYVDNPQRTGNPNITERIAPYELGGGAGFNTRTRLSDGPHSVTTATTLLDGSVVVITAGFTVNNTEIIPTPLPTITPTPNPTTDPLPSASLVGFGARTTGGVGGATCKITSLANSGSGTLRGCAEASGTAVITPEVSGTITISGQVNVQPNKTIDGQNKITVRGDELQINSTNVIITNVKFASSSKEVDAVSVGLGARDIWITHNSFTAGSASETVDGGIDIVSGTDITVDHNRFTLWNKPMLINGEGPSGDSETGGTKPHVTIHHNFFDRTAQRNPKLRHGQAHVYNNYWKAWTSYAIGVEDGGQVVSQNNIFEAAGNTRALRNDAIGSSGTVGFSSSTDDMKLGGAIVATRSPVFIPPYSITLESADNALRDRIISNAGPRS